MTTAWRRHRRQRLSCGLQEIEHLNLPFMICIFSALLCHFCLSTGVQVRFILFWIFFFVSKYNSDCVGVGGYLKWTPQRACLGNEIALAVAFCHVAPPCILMMSGSTALQDSLSLIRLAPHSHWLLLVFLLACPNSVKVLQEWTAIIIIAV